MKIAKLKKWIAKYTKKNYKSNIDIEMYDSLSPKESKEVDKDNTYCESLYWAIENDTIKNIAITGIYGSGKSSVIKKFISNYSCCYKFFNVSLASFNEHKRDINRIEECILQQIFYQVNTKRIPHSRFKKIAYISKKRLFVYELLFYLFVGLGYAIFFLQINKFTCDEILKHLLSLVTFFNILFVILFLFISHNITKFTLQRFKLVKFSFDKVGFEVHDKKEDDDKSVFNKYMDEIIYFFEATSYDVFIFEDLDRFENDEIFIKLRELNTILNNYENIKRKIVFVYAIKDDIFYNKERTKFFDFIIPIIPYLNSSNSFQILTEKISNIGISNINISKSFLLDISPFINDMRLLNNITNEFKIYKLKFINSKIDDEKLLAVIIYKNMCPKDFALLQNNKGFIYEAFANKTELISNKIKIIGDEIRKIESSINIREDQIKQATAVSLQDITYQLEGIILKKISDFVKTDSVLLNFDDNNFNIEDFVSSNDIDFDNISQITISYSNAKINPYRSGVVNGNQFFQADKDILNFIKNIPNKKKRIFSFFEDELKVKRNEIKSLTDKKNSLELKTYSELLEIIDLKYDEKYNDEVYDIAKFMLRRGYIDESFSNYISYFHEGDLSAAENNFILELKNNKSLGYKYKLMNLKLLLSKLDKRDFKNANFYNIYLLDYLLDNSGSTDKHFQECFKVAINTICNQTEENNDFISFYINFHFNKCKPQKFGHIINKLYTVLSDNWDEAFDFLYVIVQGNGERQKAILIHEVLVNSTIEKLVKQNKNMLSKILQSLDNFMEFVTDISNDKVKEIIHSLDLHFPKLKISEKSSISDYIFENGHYIFGTNYMKSVCDLYFSTNSDFYNKNYTVILQSKLSWLIDTIHKNINDYITYLYEIGTKQNDDYQILITLLNNEKMSLSSKTKLIKIENIYLESWENIDNQLWESFLFENKITPTWDNVAKYYDSFLYDDILKGYVLINVNKLAASKLEYHELATQIINDQQVNKKLLIFGVFDSQKFIYSEIENLDDDIINIIIKRGLYEYTVENFNALENRISKLSISFLKQAYKLEDFILDECTFTNEGLVSEIFKSLELDANIKKEILNIIDIEKFEYSCLSSIKDFVADNCKLEEIKFSTLQYLVTNLKLSDTIYLINSKISELTSQELLDLINSTEYLKTLVTYPKRTTLENNKDSYKFLESLKNRGIISSFNLKNDKLVAYSKKSISLN